MSRRLSAAILAALAFVVSAPAQSNPSLVFEAKTGQVLLQEGAGEPWYPASLTKLMTAYLAFQALRSGSLKLDQKVPVSSEASKIEPSKIGMPAGSQVSVDFALQSLLVYSANDMAVVLAEAVGGSIPKFVEQMNAAARRLGMAGTFFANPHGLDDARQMTTARDMGLLAALLMEEFPEFQAYFEAPFVQVGKRKLRNRNALLRQMPAADGMKTGFICDSGFNLVASATLDGRRLIAVVMGAKSGKARADLAQVLLEAGAAEIASGLAQGRPRLQELAATPAGTRMPPSMRETVCRKAERVALADPAKVSGWGVSFGRFGEALTAEAVLAGRLLATRQVFAGGASGVLKVPEAKDFAAIVWSMEQPSTLTLCSYLRARQAHCEVMPPEAFAEIARQAELMAAKSQALKRSAGKASRRKKQRQVPVPASAQ